MIDKQFVLRFFARFIARVANIDVEQTVGVQIHHDDPGAPEFCADHARLFRDIFKLKIAFVEVQLVLAHVGSKEHIGKAVVVHVADGHAAAVVEIAVTEDVEIFGILDFVNEGDAGFVGRDLFKKGIGGRFGGAANQ